VAKSCSEGEKGLFRAARIPRNRNKSRGKMTLQHVEIIVYCSEIEVPIFRTGVMTYETGVINSGFYIRMRVL
jgi:hypothetical protein